MELILFVFHFDWLASMQIRWRNIENFDSWSIIVQRAIV